MANINWHATPKATEPFISVAGQIDFDLVVCTVSDKYIIHYYREGSSGLSVFVRIQFRESAVQARTNFTDTPEFQMRFFSIMNIL